MRLSANTIFLAVALTLFMFVVQPAAQTSLGRVALVPIDDRPAVTQFTQWIGRIGDVEVLMPPRTSLGAFTTGGQPRAIAQWLRELDGKHIDAIVLSADMIAYGGLMTSRTPAATVEEARARLEIIRELRRKNPGLPIYVFSVVQRVALSATAANRAYRDRLARWSVLAHESEAKQDEKLKAAFMRLTDELPKGAVDDYLATRARNLEINLLMLDMVREGAIDELLLLQDDAHPYGLHRRDQTRLRERINQLKLTDERAKLYNGADEGSSVLVSRAVLRRHNFAPRVRVIFSSERGRKSTGTYEDQTIETSVERQIAGSGAKMAREGEPFDYTLYVNAPEQTDADFKNFLARLIADAKAGARVAVADLLFRNHWGGSDQRLVEALGREGLLDRLAGYASWNTPGNTLGTVVPQANMYVFARRKLSGDVKRLTRSREAHLWFLLHRYIGDYGYHTIVRPAVNRYAREQLKIEVEELDAKRYQELNRMVAEQLTTVAQKIFRDWFEARAHPIGDNKRTELVVKQMSSLTIRLPWPRTFEVEVDYNLRTDVRKKNMSAARQ